MICDCCERNVDELRSSVWHGNDKICKECFIEWYDGDRPTYNVDDSDKSNIGNWVRKKHGFEPLEPESMITKDDIIKFEVGDRVQRSHGYQYPGIIVAVFETLDGKVRYVVEADFVAFHGMLHIFSNADLEARS